RVFYLVPISTPSGAASAPPAQQARPIDKPKPDPSHDERGTGGQRPLLARSKDTPFINTLGMRFVPVAGLKTVLFSVWETRVQDYEVFQRATGRAWNRPPFPQGANHPAVRISWNDATDFCDWLTAKERQAAKLPGNAKYRLPTDLE